MDQQQESRQTSTVRIVAHCSLPPERVLEAGYDFSARRGKVFSAVQPKYFILHELGETTADVTEGTRGGGRSSTGNGAATTGRSPDP